VNTLTGAPIGFGTYGLDYTNYIQYSNPSGRSITSGVDPISELQSFFGRAILNYKERYLLTATLRSDGSTKFGSNNRYGWFPSVSAAWDISQEEFFKVEAINQMKVRVGYGRTGNQEFPAGASQSQYTFQNNNGGLSQITTFNPNLKWQSDEQFDIGTDFALFNNKVTVTADYFYKRTTDLLFPRGPGSPAPGGGSVIWFNLPGQIVNKGVEIIANASIFDTPKFGFSIGGNATFVRNSVGGLPDALIIQTGTLNGQGLSGVLAETIQNGQPINGFQLRTYNGINPTTGLYNEFGPLQYAGNPNPTTLVGFNTTLRYAKLSLTANFAGAFGNVIYNNTFNSVLNVSQIRSGKNISLAEYQSGVKESLSNAVTPSTRYLESGNYVKLSNLTLSYALGDLGGVFKGVNIYAIGQNLLLFTKYRGFDPEVNTNKANGVVPSAGIDYTGYPSARTFTFGFNFAL
jgi:iron complex outermembrane receptor protein